MATKTHPQPIVRHFLASDVVAALLAHFPGETFQANPTQLQAGFRCVAREHPALLGHVSFGKVGAYVGSATIETALDSLTITGFCNRYYKDGHTYDLDKSKLMKYYKSFLRPKFTQSEVDPETITQAADLLCESLIEIRESSDRSQLMVLA